MSMVNVLCPEYEPQLCASVYLESVLSIEFTDIAAKDIWTPDNGEVLRGHPRTVGVQRHLVQVPHQKVDRPEITRQRRIYHRGALQVDGMGWDGSLGGESK